MCKLSLKSFIATDIGEFFISAQYLNDSVVLLIVVMAFYNEDIVVFIGLS